jgi:hypothetical protein
LKTRMGVIVMITALALIAGSLVGYSILGEPVEGLALSPPEPPVLVGDTGEGMQTVCDLTEEEKVTVMHIIESDAHVGEILQSVDWDVKLVGLWTADQQKIGAIVLITFDRAVWIKDTFYDPSSGDSYDAELWAGSMHIFVDLRDGRIVGLTPNMGRAPITSKEHAAAAEIALSHPLGKALGENTEVYLTAVYYTDEYPVGIAFCNMRSDKGEAFVAIDLDKKVVVEQYTSRVVP